MDKDDFIDWQSDNIQELAEGFIESKKEIELAFHCYCESRYCDREADKMEAEFERLREDG